jgi:hypothetical protein
VQSLSYNASGTTAIAGGDSTAQLEREMHRSGHTHDRAGIVSIQVKSAEEACVFPNVTYMPVPSALQVPRKLHPPASLSPVDETHHIGDIHTSSYRPSCMLRNGAGLLHTSAHSNSEPISIMHEQVLCSLTHSVGSTLQWQRIFAMAANGGKDKDGSAIQGGD